MNILRGLFRARPRLFVAMVFGGVSLAYPAPTGWIVRGLVGWNVMVWVYLLLLASLMVRASHVRVRRIAEQEDRSAAVVLTIMSLAALASLVAIVLELSTARQLGLGHRLMHYALTAATVVGSWAMVGMLFTLHYARLFYLSPVTQRALRFPEGEASPDYWDFLYFSFTIAVAAQTSDVSVTSRAMRKAVLAQSVLGFVFNAAIIGFSINIAAGLVGA